MAEDKVTAILMAALELFAVHGFERTTVDEIAARAQVAKGTVFYHYKSKEELFNSLIQRGVQRLIDSVRLEMPATADPLQKLAKVVAIQTSLLNEHPEFFHIILSEAWGRQDRQAALRISLRSYFALLEEIATEGIRLGQMRPVHPSIVADMVFGMTSTAAARLLLRVQDMPLQEVIAQLQSILLQGVRAGQ